MAQPSMELVKHMARIDDTRFDVVLPTLIESATALASHEIGVDYQAEVMPAPVQQWVAAHVSFWINNPDAAAERKCEPSPFLEGLLDPYRFRDEPCIPES